MKPFEVRAIERLARANEEKEQGGTPFLTLTRCLPILHGEETCKGDKVRVPVLDAFLTDPPPLKLHGGSVETINDRRRGGLRIVLFGNGKGGCGKSTLCMNVAIGYKERRKRVLIIDGDIEQRTITKWPRPTGVENPSIVECDPASILSTVLDNVDDFDVILIDLPGRDVVLLAELLEVVDLLISPTKPAHPDLLELGRCIDVAHAKGIPHVVVMNEATRETSDEIAELQETFAKYGPFLPTAIQQLAHYRRVYAFGAGVLELKRDLPAKLNFWKVFLQIRKLVDRAHDNWVASNGRR